MPHGDHEDRILELAAAAAACLERVAAEANLPYVNEAKHLQPCCWTAAQRLGAAWDPPVATSKPQMKDSGWPKVGAVDVALTWPMELPVLLELKCGARIDALDACAWDAIKCAYALARGRGSASYLLAGTKSANWAQPIKAATLFDSSEFEAVDVRTEFAGAFAFWEKDGFPVAAHVPERFRTHAVAQYPFSVGKDRWELRLSRVVVVGNDRVSWPRLVTAH